MYRMGVNAMLLSINPPKEAINNGNQDGTLNSTSTTTGINYQPSRVFPREESPSARYSQAAYLPPPTGKNNAQSELQTDREPYRSFSRKEWNDLIYSFGRSPTDIQRCK